MRSIVVLLTFASAAGVAALMACDDATSGAPVVSTPPECGSDDQVPPTLACTGLYVAGSTTTLATGPRGYRPALELWSDGAEKHRYILLPAGARIDTSEPDDWTFPIGTRVWKEFRVAGKRIETRYLRKLRDDRWLAASYVWSADETIAERGEGRDLDLAGTPYHVPTTGECSECHDGRSDRLLGFEALGLGLPGAAGVTLDSLAAEGIIDSLAVALPDDGTGVSSPALGFLHMNCGVSCHNASSTATAYGTGLFLKLGVDELRSRPPNTWSSRATTLDVAAHTPRWSGESRIVPGDPGRSLLQRLIAERGTDQMPPIGSRLVDEEHRAAVEAWIRALSKSDPTDAGASDSSASDASAADASTDAASDAAP